MAKESKRKQSNTKKELGYRPRRDLGFIDVTQLPEPSSRKISPYVISLVNESLATIYPDQFGRLVPELKAEDIRVSPDAVVTKYIEATHLNDSHSMINRHNQQLVDQVGAKMPNLLKIWTMKRFPNRPIVYHDGDLMNIEKQTMTPDPDSKRDLRAGSVARVLLHESMHRIGGRGEIVPVTVDNPLVDLALASLDVRLAKVTELKAKTLLETQRAEILDFIAHTSLHINVHGTHVELWCPDVDGKLKIIASSGYDLEEGLVDTLGLPTYQYLVQRLGKEDALVYRVLDSSLNKTLAADNNYNAKNIMSQVPAYLKSLGLATPEEVMQAFADGMIPLLHIQKLPGKQYFA